MDNMSASQPQSQTMDPSPHALSAEGAINVGDTERWLSLLGGGLLAFYTLRRSLGSIALLCGAGALMYRGMTGQCGLYQKMGVSTVAHDRQSESSRAVTAPDDARRVVLVGS